MRPGFRAGVIACGLLVFSAVGCRNSAGFRGVPAEGVVETVEVFYGTDRAADDDRAGTRAYGWRREYHDGGAPYDLGVCEVEIKRHRNHDTIGPLPKSSSELVSVVSTDLLERDRFYERIRETMWYAGSNDTFVFIHGFNNTFEDAAKRTAEIWYDVEFKGPPIMFSWPTRGGSFWRGVFGYFADSETVKWSVAHLKEFLLDLVDETSPDRLHADEPARIHLIAHSMGSRALIRTLMLVADELGRGDRPLFCDVILAAPDIDRDLFRDVIVVDLLRARLAEHYTLYASSSDTVIKTSQKLQVYPRAGNADDGLVAVHHDSFDTIDASAIQSGWLTLNHDYFITEPEVIRDLQQILCRGNRDPGAYGRSMRRRAEGPGEPWVLPSDEESARKEVVSGQ